MTVKLNVRVTSKSKCREGFYLVINGERIRANTRAAALESLFSWLKLQRIYVCTVREYAERHRKKIAARMPETEPDLGCSPDAIALANKLELEGLGVLKKALLEEFGGQQ